MLQRKPLDMFLERYHLKTTLLFSKRNSIQLFFSHLEALAITMLLYFLQRAMRLGVRNVRILVRGMGTGRLVCTQITLLPSATKLRQGNVFTGVCQSFCSQRGRRCLADTPPGQTTPPGRPPRQATPGKTPPPVHAGIHSNAQCMLGYAPTPGGHCSGRYASYWNAFLCSIVIVHPHKLGTYSAN